MITGLSIACPCLLHGVRFSVGLGRYVYSLTVFQLVGKLVLHKSHQFSKRLENRIRTCSQRHFNWWLTTCQLIAVTGQLIADDWSTDRGRQVN